MPKSSKIKSPLLPTPLEVVDYNFKIPVIRISQYGRTVLNLKPDQDIYIYEDLNNLQLVLSVYELKRSMYNSIMRFSDIEYFTKLGLDLWKRKINILSSSFYKRNGEYRATLLYEVPDRFRAEWGKDTLQDISKKIPNNENEDKLKVLDTIEYSEREVNNKSVKDIVVPLIQYHDIFKKSLKSVKISKNWTIYYKISDDFIDRAFPHLITDAYLFRWDKIPGNDNSRLIRFLKKRFDISWIERANINKTDDDRTIRFTEDNNFLSLKLNNEQTKVNLEINDGRTDELIAIMENDKLNICTPNFMPDCKCIQIAELDLGILILKFYEPDIFKINIEILNLPGSFVRFINICKHLNIKIEAIGLHKISLEEAGSAEIIYILKLPDKIINNVDEIREFFVKADLELIEKDKEHAKIVDTHNEILRKNTKEENNLSFIHKIEIL